MHEAECRQGRVKPGLDELATKLRISAGALFVDNFFQGLSSLGRLHPAARPERHDVEVIRDVPYRPSSDAAHRLDVYRPKKAASGPRPAVIYVHGGGFRILSKDSHWLMGLAFARRGYTVFNVDYRLAPRNPYPAAVEDVCHAYDWVVRNAESWGGDADRLLLAGESAGANLVTALAVAGSWHRPEAFARLVFESPKRPRGVIAACGILQVSEPERFLSRRRLPFWLFDRIREVQDAYLPPEMRPAPEDGHSLADPLLVVEGGAPVRELPPFHVFCGTRDPLLDDSRRLKAALDGLGTPCGMRVYPGGIHAFHAMVWTAMARECWRECFAFSDGCCGPAEPLAPPELSAAN